MNFKEPEYRNRVYSCEDRVDMHETTHLLFSQLGRHVGIFDEGIAIHLGQELVGNGWRGKPCSWWIKKFIEEKKLPKISSIINPKDFYMKDWSVVGGIHYPVACSFVSFLINKYGMDKFKQLFSELNDDNQHYPQLVNMLFKNVYVIDIDNAEKQWLSSF